MTDGTEDEWAYLARRPLPARHSLVKVLAPTPETALTVTCEDRVLARVWPRGPIADQFVATANGRYSPLLDGRWPTIVAPCECDSRMHAIDRLKLLNEVKKKRNTAAARKPSVDVACVSRDKPDSDT